MVAARMAPIRPAPSVRPISRKEHARHQRADDADENVAQEAKFSSLHQKSGEPAGNRANNQAISRAVSMISPRSKN